MSTGNVITPLEAPQFAKQCKSTSTQTLVSFIPCSSPILRVSEAEDAHMHACTHAHKHCDDTAQHHMLPFIK